MRRTLLFMAVVAVVLGSALAAVRQDASWKKVEQAMAKGLPKTAIRELEPIIQRALKEKQYGEAAKAITTKIALEGNIQGNKPEERILRLQTTMKDLPGPMQPVMEAVLAHWYWHYFQQNRWRFMRRTATSEPPGDDIKAWDLRRILAEIDHHFTAALKAETQLQATPVGAFDQLLEKGTMPDALRPTMFDFLAHEALQFYSAGEQAGAAAEDAFVLQADSPIFASVKEFLAWKPESTDTNSATLKAIHLYQKLLHFHGADGDPNALADADLARLRFGHNKAFGEDKDHRYKAALTQFTERWRELQVAAMAYYQHAEVLRSEDELVEAHALADKGRTAFPDSPGGKLCHNLIQQIEAKNIQVTTERVWNAPWPTLDVSYRNITRVHFRIIKYDWLALLQRRDYQPGGGISQSLRTELLKHQPDRSWSAQLAPTDDYRMRTAALAAPRDLPPGFYFVLASVDARFGSADNRVVAASFWRSDLAVVLRTGTGQGVMDGFVLDAESGDPLAGAQVRAWCRQRSNWVETKPVTTNRDGRFVLSGLQRAACVVLARQGQWQLSTMPRSSNSAVYQPKPYERTLFFTDRAIYRPGQTVRYKGLSIAVDQQHDNYSTQASHTVTVVFRDTNRKEIARQTHRTNDYGSFSGSFTAPRDRLLGRMSLVDEARRNSRSYFYVEEYKRPKFRVELQPPDQPAQLGKRVAIPGSAKAYTGAPVGDAQVAYRIVRQVQYPPWCFFWWPMPGREAQEIAHGVTRTNQDGSFTVAFAARPDPSAERKNEPTFQYTIHADVTDISGETRSDQSVVRIGYTSLQATMSAVDWQTVDKPVALSIATRTLDGEPQAAKGQVRIYRLQSPPDVVRPPLGGAGSRHWQGRSFGAAASPPPDLSNPEAWKLGAQVVQRPFATDATGAVTLSIPLKTGAYRATLETTDPFGNRVTARLGILVVDPAADRFQIKVPNRVAAPTWQVEPKQTFLALWGTGYESGRAYVEVEHRGKVLQHYWTPARDTQAIIEQQVTETMRGGFTIRVTQIHDNRAHIVQRTVTVPWTNKQLTVRWEHFVSKLKPGQQEHWTAIIQGDRAEQAATEFVATLYDASLEAFRPHSWPGLNVFRHEYNRVQSQFENNVRNLQPIFGSWNNDRRAIEVTYRHFPGEIAMSLYDYGWFGNRGAMRMRRGAMPAPAGNAFGGVADAPMEMMAESRDVAGVTSAAFAPDAKKLALGEPGSAPSGNNPSVDLSQVSARKNLNETAFFYPHLRADKDGRVTLEFTMPEALTTWKFIGLAHDRQLRSGLLMDEAVTSKDLMVQPMPPRFLREGDVLEFPVKVTNQSAARQTGTVRLTLADAVTLAAADAQLDNTAPEQSFDVPAGESRVYSWKLTVPDGARPLTYKAVGSTGRLSDGEEGFLPILSRRILVTESLPLPVRDAGTHNFKFTKLLESAQSDTLRHETLTLQMVSNPAWYAVMALPYLMEYPYECSEQTFNRLYANLLARYIATSDPKIQRVFEQWKGTPALDSPLEKNADLKAVLLEETPWVRQAESESAARHNVGILFDTNRLNDETSRIMRKLTELQLADGAWPWFPGGRANDYITLYITTGFGRLRHLGTDVDVQLAVKALARLDAWITRRYRDIQKHGDLKANHLSPSIALYLYGRSFYLEDRQVAPEHRQAVDYFLQQARRFWLQLNNRQSQAHLALALTRFGDRETARSIMRSIKERSVTDDELGMFWRDRELSWWWYRAPIETQAVMIEAFDEVMNDTDAVAECRVWLLKQKQTQDWKTTKATADAIYALLLRGTNLLASDALVRVQLGSRTITPDRVEAGTGFYEQRFVHDEIKPQLGNVRVTKTDPGVAWGSLHWQYLEDVAKVAPYAGTPLTIHKRLYVKRNTKSGPTLTPVRGPLSVGDELVVRVELRVDRDMEYVHLKDQRGSGLEPVDVLSQYHYRDGLAYYQSTRDTASHFFIDYLPKGTYVFEYSTRVVHRGVYQSGMAQIQCMYAPEFNSHSASVALRVE